MESDDSSFSDLNNKIDTFSAKTSSLSDEVSSLNNRLNLLETDKANLSFEFILTEFYERQQCANNILLFNLPETKITSDPSDDAIVIKLLSVLNLNTAPVRLSRLGKYSVKPRPIKVELPTCRIVFDV